MITDYFHLSDNTELRAIKPWERPDYWSGKSWSGWYVALPRTRDSDALTESNFRVLKKMLDELPEVDVDDSRNGEKLTVNGVQVVCESHWAYGWIEWIAIHETAEEALLVADRALCSLQEYPCLDEQDWCELEDEEMQSYWKGELLRNRIKLCANNGESIFAARRDYPPTNVCYYLRDPS